MLSAVAARKARLEGKQVVQVVPRTPAKLAIVADESPKLVSPPSKRKPSENASKPIKKKRKKAQQPAQDTPPRYFNEDAFKTQQDVIVVADDSDDSEEGFTGDAFVAEADMTVDNADATNTATPATKARRRRAWSPSAPLRDSSDEEDDELLDDESAPPPVVIPVAGPSKLVPKVLSTFQPVLDQNMFYLTPEDIQILDLPSPSLQCDNTGTLIVLHPSNSLALLGTYRLTVLQGAVSLMGSVLTASRTCHRVFAPRSSPIPVLRSVAASLNGPQSAMPDRVRSTLGPAATVVLLQELQTGVERLGTVCRTFEGVFSPSRSQSKMPTVELNLRGVYMLQAETSDTSPFIMPPSWDATISSMVDHNANPQEMNYPRSVYLVKGPRNTGKSTFGKVLLNALLTRYRRVAFLECDLGQSEFTPAGMVALSILDAPVFGPAFTHPCLPYASHFVGATSPKSSPSYYVECVQALIQAYNLDIQHGALLNDNDDKGTDNRLSDIIPLVVNTMGWSRGLGSDLSLKIEETVEPSQIFELEAPQGDDAYPTYPPFDSADAHASHGLGGLDRVRRLEAVAPCSASSFFTAADHRTLSVLSYFHATFAAPSSSPPASQDAPVSSPSSSASATSCIARAWDVSLPLCAQLPYEVDCQAAFDHIALVGAGMEDVVPSELVHVLSGAIVGLVQCEAGTMDDLASDSASPVLALPYKQGNPPPSPFSSKCCGLALVRAISHSATGTLMHLLTPVPPEHLVNVRVLVKGELELPVWGMLDFRNTQGDVAGVERDKVPFLRWGKSEAAGAERRRVRRNLMRRGQM